MRRLVLGIGYPRCEYEATQNEWRQYGIEFEFADDFNQAILKLGEQDYACVAVCADCLPYDDIDALRRVRPIPIVVLPAEYNAVQRYECVQRGAAQYLRAARQRRETFSSDQEALRHWLNLPVEEWKPLTIITTKDLSFCLEHHTVEVRGQLIDLTAKEFALLALLISNPKMVFTYSMLFQQIWKDEYTLTSKKTLNNHMSSLRRKLKIAPDVPDFIINIHSVGYKYDLT